MVDDRREHERLELALEAAQLGTWTWDRRPARTAWDARLEAMHGMAPGSFGGTFEDWQASIAPRRPRRVRRAASSGHWPIPAPTSCSTAPTGPTGRSTGSSAAGACSPTTPARRLGTIGVVLDVTEREERQAALDPPHRRGPPPHPERAARAAPGPHAPGRRHRVRGALRRRAGLRDRRRLVRVRARCAVAVSASRSATSPATACRRWRRWRTSASACVRSRTCTTTPPRCSRSSASSCACSRPTRWSPRSTAPSTRTRVLRVRARRALPARLCGPASCELVDVRADPPLGLGEKYERRHARRSAPTRRWSRSPTASSNGARRRSR